MRDHSAASTPEVDTITRMAHYARAHQTTVRWLLWSPVPPILAIVLMAVYGVRTGDNQWPISPLLSALPFFLLVGWSSLKQERMHRACRQFNNILGQHHDIWHTVSPAAIGPLLEA